MSSTRHNLLFSIEKNDVVNKTLKQLKIDTVVNYCVIHFLLHISYRQINWDFN